MDIRQVSHFSNSTGVLLWPIAKKSDLPEVLVRLGKNIRVAPETIQFKGETKEIFCIFSPKLNRNIFLLGLGEKPTSADILAAFRSFSFQMRKRLTGHLTISFSEIAHLQSLETLTELAVAGISQGAYSIPHYKTENQPAQHPLRDPEAVLFIVSKQAKLESALIRSNIIAESQSNALDLINAPANVKTPAFIASWAQESGRKYGYDVQAFVGRKKLEELGLHALLAVNQGSNDDPAFLVISYEPKNAPATLPHLGLVGKGVTFDTGGVNLKDGGSLYNMKSDMGGASAVLCAIEAIARLQLPIKITATIPLTDNNVDGAAYRPSEVIKTFSGRTIEIIDTDAEGRVILADGLSYLVRKHKPDVVLDLATLTGSIIRTLGYHAAGLFSNNDELADRLYQVGQQAGERLWRLPTWNIYAEDIVSDVADVRNLSGKPIAGAISAAKFLEVFTDKHPAWAHLDIAGTAFGNIEYSTTQKAGTAYGVRLLIKFAESMIKQPITP
jgi:leucyl aminopeptidase